MRIASFMMFLSVLMTALGFAKQTASDIPVTSTLADLDATSTPCDDQSDGRGAAGTTGLYRPSRPLHFVCKVRNKLFAGRLSA